MSFNSALPFFIFDFDGTLANTFELAIEAVNHLSPEYGFELLTEEKVDYLRGLPARKVLKVMGVSWYRIPELIVKVQRYMKSRMQEINLYPGVAEMLHHLKSKHYALGVITTNSKENVEILLNKYDCNVFNFIHTSYHVFGKSKVLNKVIRQHQLDKKRVYYVGDEARDIDAARACHIKSIAVTWGFNKKELLVTHHPDCLIEKAEDLVFLNWKG